MSTIGTVVSPTKTNTHLEMMAQIRKEIETLLPPASSSHLARSVSACLTFYGTTAMRHPDWDVVEVALAAVGKTRSARWTYRNAAVAVFARAFLKTLRKQQKAGSNGVLVHFEGTQMPLLELTDCQLHALQWYAWTWLLVDAFDESPSRLQGRIAWVIKCGIEKMPNITCETREQVARAFKLYVEGGGEPRALLL